MFSNALEFKKIASRVILNDQLNKIANVALSDINRSTEVLKGFSHVCQESLDWKNESFWKNLPHPRNSTKVHKEYIHQKPLVNVDLNALLKIKTPKAQVAPILTCSTAKDDLMRRYFLLWKEAASLRKKQTKLCQSKTEHQEKLDKFIKQLKKQKKARVTKDDELKPDIKITSEVKPVSNYKNRCTAQKTIIDMQKNKLEEQNKLIDELKLGIIREDLLKSIENTKTNIREIFAGCSEKIKIKVPMILVEENKFNISTQKAPKIVQKMESRALERARNREIILEKKRIIDEARQKMVEKVIENKRVLEEEEKKRALKEMKERRQRELEVEKMRQANKQKYMEKLETATTFHNKLLLKQCFRKLYNNFVRSRNNHILAEKYHERKVLKRSFVIWMNFVEELYTMKYEIAHAHFAWKLLKNALTTWKQNHQESIRNMQVAEDLYDFRLTSNTFIHWHRYVCKRIILEDKNIEIARQHYNRRILFQCFYQWRSLKAVIELEKAKELKKRKWREKVWEILPDYKPPEDI